MDAHGTVFQQYGTLYIYIYVHGYKIGISTTDVNQPSDRNKTYMAGKNNTIVSWFTAHSNVPLPVYDS